MKKKLSLDLMLDDLSKEDLIFLQQLKDRSIKREGIEENFVKIHDCGHDSSEKCTKEVTL